MGGKLREDGGGQARMEVGVHVHTCAQFQLARPCASERARLCACLRTRGVAGSAVPKQAVGLEPQAA